MGLVKLSGSFLWVLDFQPGSCIIDSTVFCNDCAYCLQGRVNLAIAAMLTAAVLTVLTAALPAAIFFTGCATQKPGAHDRGEAAEDSYTLGPLDFPVVKSEYPAPFSKGVNFTEWFQSPSPQTIPFTKYTEESFEQAKSLGVDVIRLPINLHSFTNGLAGNSAGASAYTLDPLFLRLLDHAVDWAEKYGMYLILDNHSFDPVKDTPENIGDILRRAGHCPYKLGLFRRLRPL
jgi:hypothetical protein